VKVATSLAPAVFQGRAMGSDIVFAARAERAAAELAWATVAEMLAEVEGMCSRFRADSELSRVNAAPGPRVRLSPTFAEVVGLALDAAQATEGLFDPGLLAAVRAAGYVVTFAELPAWQPLGERAPGGGWRAARLHGDTLVRPAGFALDLGGVAKGWAVDRALAAVARRWPGLEAVLDAGGDVAVSAASAAGGGWEVGLERGGAIQLKRGAVATSGSGRRRWRAGAGWAHHLIDPAEGAPVSGGFASVTAVAGSAAQADVAATALAVAGPARFERLVHAWGVSAIAFASDGATSAARWPPPAA